MRKSFASAIAAMALVNSNVVQAQTVNSEMNNFFSDLGVAGNVTGPSAFQGQAAGYYTGGNVWTRFPEKTVNPINIQLPSVRAGCGGIDIFSGSFSFINAAEFVAMLKATANNAIGFAFKLAIDSISPEIGNVMGELSARVQDLNQMQISSCETAQNMIGSIWPKTQMTTNYMCQQIGNNQGIFSDYARSRWGCGAGGDPANTINQNTDPNVKNLPGIPQNFTWEALKRSYPSMSSEFKEFLMTLVGTTIVNTTGQNTGSTLPRYTSEAGAGAALYSEMLDGANYNAKVLKCDETDKCMNPTKVDFAVPIATAIKPEVKKLILSMMTKSRDPSQALSNDELVLLGSTSVPLYKMIMVHNASQLGSLSDAEQDYLSEIVSIDLLNSMANKFLDLAVRSSASFEGADAESLGRWRQQLNDAKHQFSQLKVTNDARFMQTLAIMEKTVMAERSLRTQLSPQLSGAMSFSRGMANQGIR